MIGGTYFVATGTIPGWVWVASLPYAILVTTVLFGKHNRHRSVRTRSAGQDAPVILARRNAPGGLGMMIAFYPIVIGSAWSD